MAGERLADFHVNGPPSGHVAVKEAVLPFARFPGVDLLLGPEMKSTGEVMGLDRDFGTAFAKSQLGRRGSAADERHRVRFGQDIDKPAVVRLGRDLAELGFALVATRGTAAALAEAGIRGRDRQQGARGAAAYRRFDQERDDHNADQHDRWPAGD